ncbi:MAG TPA: M10 family metallopeptidase C-terminal domain-containing protein [Sphingomicrobium sp.]
MPDIPGDNSTTTSITVGGSVSSTLESLGDRDWIRIDLVAGQAITVLVDGTTLEDPYVYIHNAAGTVLFSNDDINPGVLRDSQVSFTVPTTGTYYIEVGSFEDSYTGDYTVSVSNYTPPPLASYDTIAQELIVDYWGAGQQHHFDVTQGGSISVNITGLTAAGKTLARAALAEWTDIIGVNFVEVTTGGQITFDDNQSGAATDGTWSGGIATSAHVNVSTQWLAQYGTGLNSYSFQTYIHEIGHALGLGHAGYYNGTASYPNDARFQNDAWVTSIMSYFDQNDNTYFAGQGFTSDFVVTPMLADIVAMSQMYGLSTTTRTGNTIYGFNSNAGNAVYNAAQNPDVAYTIFDSGGTDTLDYSGFGTNQTINLNPETFSNVGPGVGNVAIARGVVIENAIGGSGNDTLYGNAANNVLTGNAGNDTLDGGAGADMMIGGLGDDKYYIADVGDLVVEAANQGDDTTFVLGTYTLAQGVSIETLVALNQASTDPLVLTGNDFGQSLYGNLGNNYLNGGQGNDFLVGLAGNDNLLGGTGADNMQGGVGNDVYYVDQSGDQIFENAGEGDDIAVATASWTLTAGASVETLSADPGAGNINLTGNDLAQSLYGNSGNNVLTGNGGADYMVGGAGNDTYYVDPSDFIAEDVGGGDDSIVIATSYILREGNEIETLVALNQGSTDPVNLTGNEFGQSLYGSQGNNMLNGGAGDDFLVGLGGNDFLIGGPGNDILQGGQGNDVYYVETGDWVFETPGEGDDLVVAFSSFALIAGHSVETLTAAEGVSAINLTGNELAQSIYGNAGDNRISGMGGSDYILGGGGNDTFVIANAPGVATIADYGVGDVVDVTQLLNVANGTDVVAGGYLKVTASGQLQIDANGGADAFVTVANVSGSGAVAIRYIAGGNLADVSVSRSAGQEAAAVTKLAPDAQAADLHSGAPLVHPGDGWASTNDAALHDPFAPFATHLDPHALI